MRYRNGAIMAKAERERGELPEVDYVAGVPDSGTPHAIGYAHESGLPFGRPFIKYTPTWPRSFMPANQEMRNRVATMKQVPVPQLIEGKKLLFVDDSIVRGTQLRNTVDFLYESGAAEVHMRSACPPIMFGCKYLTFSRNDSVMDLIGRRVAKKLEGLALTVSASTTDGKKLYGAVSVTDLLAAIEAQRGVKIERGQFSLEESLREVGEYEAKIDLGHGVFAKCKITILDEQAQAE